MEDGGATDPLLSITITPHTAEDATRLARALVQLTDDPHLRVLSDDGSEVELGGASEAHLEIVIDRLHRAFGVNGALSRPRVLYREALTRAADGEAKHARRIADRGEYAHVKVAVYPATHGTGRVIETRIAGQIPDQFMASVKLGITDGLAHGVLGGYAIEDVRVEICDGSYHDVDSTDAAFRLAASLAVQRAARNADPVLMEPIMRLAVVIPAEYEADVRTSLAARRACLEGILEVGDTRIIRARVPLAQLFGYATDLRARTLGRGSYAVELHAFEPCAREDDDDRASNVRARIDPAPRPRRSGIALPEPDVD
jgi:elongation factor G